ARTTFGQIGVKVWIYKGEILPERAAAATPSEEETREGPAPAIAPESVRGPELEAPSPTAEALAEATGQPAPKPRGRRKAVEPEAAPGDESLGAEERTESLGGVLTEAEATGETVAPQADPQRADEPADASETSANEDAAIEKVEAAPPESGSEASAAAGESTDVEAQVAQEEAPAAEAPAAEEKPPTAKAAAKTTRKRKGEAKS
ncbi:MAG TPA: hypothetical protein VFZ12_01465, partial [Dehalococcoidia bacterium]|nr:hypothetical protein [Dehalococcoidia bacterium]